MQYNRFVFQPGEQITLVLISPFLFKSIRIELTIMSFDQQKQQYVCRRKDKNLLQYLPKEKKLYKKLLFKGHDLPFTLDSETNKWSSNHYYHFVTTDPDNLRIFLNQHCLTLTNGNKSKIGYRDFTQNGIELQQRRLYTDEQILQDKITDDDCPFDL